MKESIIIWKNNNLCCVLVSILRSDYACDQNVCSPRSRHIKSFSWHSTFMTPFISIYCSINNFLQKLGVSVAAASPHISIWLSLTLPASVSWTLSLTKPLYLPFVRSPTVVSTTRAGRPWTRRSPTAACRWRSTRWAGRGVWTPPRGSSPPPSQGSTRLPSPPRWTTMTMDKKPHTFTSG
jgi:hypothetical protein